MDLGPRALRDLNGRIKPRPLSGVTGFLQQRRPGVSDTHISGEPQTEAGRALSIIAVSGTRVQRGGWPPPLVLIRPPMPACMKRSPPIPGGVSPESLTRRGRIHTVAARNACPTSHDTLAI